MSQQLQLRRAVDVTLASFTGAQGEVLVGTTSYRLFAQDGVTPGGHATAFQTELGSVNFVARGVNLAVAGDTQITIIIPPGFSLYLVDQIIVSAATPNPPAAVTRAGVFTAASAGGTALLSGGQVAIPITATVPNTNNNCSALALAASIPTTAFNYASLFFHVGTISTVACSVDVAIQITPLS